MWSLHRLVATAFIKKGNNRMNVVRAKDKNHLNCNVNNLEWCWAWNIYV